MGCSCLIQWGRKRIKLIYKIFESMSNDDDDDDDVDDDDDDNDNEEDNSFIDDE